MSHKPATHHKKIAIFGVTGSIGGSTVDVLTNLPDFSCQEYSIEVVTGGDNVEKLAQIAIALKAKRAVIANPHAYHQLVLLLSGTDIKPSAGASAIVQAATIPVDWAIMAISGIAALAPLAELITQGCTIALANKEALVCAGDALLKKARQHCSVVLPVDSEHNAIFQILENQSTAPCCIWLTASGGALRDYPIEQLSQATAANALLHPNWAMGKKITVDSATMMNKVLERIEAIHMFDLPPESVKVIIHRQSIAHGFVALSDGTLIGLFSPPDMRYAIAHALYWPQRALEPINCGGKPHNILDFCALGEMSFHPPDARRYPALQLGEEVAKTGGNAPCILNAANDVAVDAFLSGRINFTDITKACEAVLSSYPHVSSQIDDNLDIEKYIVS